MSIYYKIRVIFLVAVLFTTAFFGAFFLIQKKDHLKQIQKRYVQTAFYISRHMKQNKTISTDKALRDSNLKLFLKESDFSIIQKRKKAKEIQGNGFVVQQRKVMKSKMILLRRRGDMYLWVKNPKFSVLLQDGHPPSFPWVTLASYLLALAMLFMLYLWLTRSLKPLKTLQEKIQKVSAGDLTVSVKSNKKDEIAQVANAFDDALRKLESLINSRQLFLRSIMHELKTPIAKGKLINEFLEEGKEKDGYETVFERLELLIEEFSKIEQMLSSSYKAKLAHYNARDIVEQALELMILDEHELSTKVLLKYEENYKVYADFELLSLALKNLIDNAIKYSSDHKVVIMVDRQGISVTNKGTKFTDTLEPYLEPFHGQKHGLGLGLYIVQNITKMLSLKLAYDYNKGKISFRISE